MKFKKRTIYLPQLELLSAGDSEWPFMTFFSNLGFADEGGVGNGRFLEEREERGRGWGSA